MSYINKVEATKKYFSSEVIKLGLIPGIDKHFKLYNLHTKSVKQEDGRYKRVNLTEMTKRCLPAKSLQSPWAETPYRYYFMGKDIIKFLKLNDIK